MRCLKFIVDNGLTQMFNIVEASKDPRTDQRNQYVTHYNVRGVPALIDERDGNTLLGFEPCRDYLLRVAQKFCPKYDRYETTRSKNPKLSNVGVFEQGASSNATEAHTIASDIDGMAILGAGDLPSFAEKLSEADLDKLRNNDPSFLVEKEESSQCEKEVMARLERYTKLRQG
jgi:hypothetical protein